jgi:predicted DNA-binding transcriptional regulator AlpA
VARLLDQREAAQILSVSVRTLERHRVTGTGPRFCRLGRLIRYRERDLEEFVGRSLRTSTSGMPDAMSERAALIRKSA